MKKLFALLTLTFIASVLFLLPGRADADVNDFVIHEFDGRYELFNDVHGGRLQVEEDIHLTFSDYNHGIYRAIPTDYQGHSAKLHVTSIERDGNSEPFTSYEQANNKVLKIGNANQTITGDHSYKIKYEMIGVVNYQNGFDEWYWDVNGNQWGQPFEKVAGEVIFPASWNDQGLPTPACYTGKLGSTEQACQLTRTDRGYKFEASRRLEAFETLTVASPLQKGLITPRDRNDWLRDNWWQLVGIATGVITSLVCFNVWRKYGKDYKGRGVIVPEYEPPKGLSPAEVGLLMDYRVDGRDLSATIIDLAVRGYIQIHDEQKTQALVFKKREFSLELVNDDFAGLKPHESSLLGTLFSPATKGALQSISKIDRTAMYTTVTVIRRDLKSKLTKDYGLFEDKPTHVRNWLIATAVGSFVLLFVTGQGWGWILGLIWAMLSAIFYAGLMRRRSHAGVEAYEKVKGLELYMKTAEKDRLKMLQSVDRPYAAPSQTVELFEKLLPFAVALGVEKSWSKQFEDIYKQPPSWYDGNFSTFQMAAFANTLTTGVSAMNSSFSASTSSSSSGSGGGGFSGGGGGGGGGGGW